MQRLEATVFGKVQGVSYRAYVAREGRRLGLTGSVHNLSDGSVSVVAEGPRVSIQSFVSRLYEGPGDSKIERVDTRWSDALGKFSGFDIDF